MFSVTFSRSQLTFYATYYYCATTKSWHECATHEDIRSIMLDKGGGMHHVDAGGGAGGGGAGGGGRKGKQKGRQMGKSKWGGVLSAHTLTDVSKVERISDILADHEIHVCATRQRGGNYRKEDVETLVAQLGGALVANPIENSTSLIVAPDKGSMQVKSLYHWYSSNYIQCHVARLICVHTEK